MNYPPSNGLKDHTVLCAIIAIYLFPAFIVLTTFPVFYDDESWLYLPAIEALRGNGFSWAAFGQGHSSNFTFDAIAYSLLWLSPFSLESTIRIISTGAGALVLVAAYLAARLLAPKAALIAPLLLVLSGQFYWLSRYGRSDCLSLLLSTVSIWLALAERPMLAGIGAGLSTSIYPLNGWVVCFDGFIAHRKRGWKGLVRCGTGIAIGVSWQVYGIAAHFTDVAASNKKFAVSASIHSGSGFLQEILQSIANERERYNSYFKLLFQQGDYASIAALFILAICLALSLKNKKRWMAMFLAATPLASMAVLVGLKNPYEFIFCLPSLAIASAIGAEYLPRRLFVPVTACAFGLTVAVLWPPALQRLGAPRPQVVFATAANALPEGTAVFGPVLFAPVMENRPDIRFFTYHAFSPRDNWQLPPCRDFPAFVRKVLQTDGRRTSQNYLQEQPNSIYLIWKDGYRLGYLRLIWPNLSDQEADCLMPVEQMETKVVTIPGKRRDQDERIVIGRLDLDRTP